MHRKAIDRTDVVQTPAVYFSNGDVATTDATDDNDDDDDDGDAADASFRPGFRPVVPDTKQTQRKIRAKIKRKCRCLILIICLHRRVLTCVPYSIVWKTNPDF